jgi:hypothetical protein
MRLCGFFARLGFSIADAKIHTTATATRSTASCCSTPARRSTTATSSTCSNTTWASA